MKRKQPSKPTATATFANSEIQHIEQLLALMSEHNLEEFEYSQGDLKIRLKKPSAAPVYATGRPMPAPEIIVSGGYAPPASSAPPPPPAPATHAPPEARQAEDLHLVKSPIVGTYYESPSPGSEPSSRWAGISRPAKPCALWKR